MCVSPTTMQPPLHTRHDTIRQALWQVSLVLTGIKQVVNVAQLCSAAMALAEGDANKKKAK